MQPDKSRPSASYGFGVTLALPIQQAVEQTKAVLKEQGFGVLTEIDVQATLRQKLDVTFRPYLILGACNPSLAYRALTAEPDIGLLLPCNVVVSATDDATTHVAFLDPVAALGLVGDDPELASVAREARARLQQARDALTGN